MKVHYKRKNSLSKKPNKFDIVRAQNYNEDKQRLASIRFISFLTVLKLNGHAGNALSNVAARTASGKILSASF